MNTRDQVKLASNLLSIAHHAIEVRDHETLDSLSKITEALDEATGNDYFEFFDLGEYFYDVSQDVKNGRPIEQDEWAFKLGEKLKDAVRLAQAELR